MSQRPIRLCIAALGGQGGGVLADWLVEIAEAQGYLAQSTSVPGVAQRTGATIYYLEFFPLAESERAGGEPIMALMPVPGDVDCVIASELVEAGRAVQRGLVTPAALSGSSKATERLTSEAGETSRRCCRSSMHSLLAPMALRFSPGCTRLRSRTRKARRWRRRWRGCSRRRSPEERPTEAAPDRR